MFFRRLPPHSLDTASDMAEHAIRIAYGFKHNKKYVPTEFELEKFEQFEKELWQHYCAARYILRCMYARVSGRPEDPHQWYEKSIREDDNKDS